jgi:ketosteroid isomerase-like protein
MKNLCGLLAIPMVLLTLTCASAQSVSANLLKAERQLIEENNAKYFTAIAKNDVADFSRQYAVDCWIMVPDMPIHCGPDAPSDYFKGVLATKNIAGGKFITVDIYGAESDVLAEVGFYQFYDKSGLQFDNGKYVTLWKKADGQWKRFRETLSSSCSR